MMSLKQNTQLLTESHNNYAKVLNVHAFCKIHDNTIGEDLVQETFIKTWKYLLKGGKIHLMRAFLYHILNNLIVDEYRKKKTSSLDLLVEKGFQPSIDPTKHLFNFVDGKAATLLISKLPEKYQKVMQMRYVQCLTLKEMSLITGQSKNSLAVQSYRGLNKLKLLYNAAV